MQEGSARQVPPQPRPGALPGLAELGARIAALLPRTGRPGALLRETGAGFVAACLSLPLCIGAGVLAYTPLGPDYLARGAAAGLACAIAGGIVAAAARRSSFVVTFPTTPICVIQATLMASLLAACGGNGDHALAAAALMVILVGLWQVLFALSGVTRFVEFVPHPVMAGFVTGVAGLIAWHQVPAFLGVHSLRELAPTASLVPHPVRTAFALALFVAILAAGRYAPKVPNLLLGLVGGSAVFHLVRVLSPGTDLGSTIGALPAMAWTSLPIARWAAARDVLVTLPVLKIALVGSFTLALVGTLDTFFALRAAQFLTDEPIQPRRDVAGQGAGNIASALVGGLVVSTSLSVSMANHRAGGRTRWSTIASGGVLLLGGLLLPTLISFLPLVVIAAILAAVSVRLVDRWSLTVLLQALASRERPRRLRALPDAVIVLAVCLSTILGHPVLGVAVGIALAGVVFILDMSRPVVAQRRGTSGRGVRRADGPSGNAVLRLAEPPVAILELRGVLFFGNAHGLAADLRALEGEVDAVILDCRMVTDVDTSGLAVLGQAASRFRSRGMALAICGTDARWFEGPADGTGRVVAQVFPDLDAALSWARARRRASGESPAVEGREGEAEFETLARLGDRLELVQFPAGSVVCRAGEQAECMWILKSGTVAVFAPGAPGGPALARLGPGSTVGEMGLLERQPRSADVYAETAVEAWFLSAESFAEIQREEPHAAQSVAILIAKELSRRLRRASGEHAAAGV